VGDGVENLLRGALPEASRDDATVASCVAGMRAEYGRRWADQTCLYAGVPELLDGLTGRRVRMAILSNKPDDMTRVIAAHFLSAWRFEVVLGARSTVPRKPDPTAALEIARELGLPPREFLYLGDTRIDMETARGAGMSPVGALWGFRTAEELTASGATALLEKPADLLALV
jgi:phosphoglycolate phosphatase